MGSHNDQESLIILKDYVMLSNVTFHVTGNVEAEEEVDDVCWEDDWKNNDDVVRDVLVQLSYDYVEGASLLVIGGGLVFVSFKTRLL